MRKETFKKNISYIFDPNRKNAHYSLNGETFFNHGDLCEILAKSVLGYEPKKDANTRHDKGHDIPELNASVKSYKCGLSDRKDLRVDKWYFFNKFFADELPNTTYIWVYEYGDFVDLWFMDMNEFKTFVLKCGSWDDGAHEKKWRFTKSNNTINKYLENSLVG